MVLDAYVPRHIAIVTLFLASMFRFQDEACSPTRMICTMSNKPCSTSRLRSEVTKSVPFLVSTFPVLSQHQRLHLTPICATTVLFLAPMFRDLS